MPQLEIVKYPAQILREPSAEVAAFDAELHRLLDDMAQTMYGASGIGLAAPQVNVPRRIAVVDVSEERNQRIELVNPLILSQSGKVSSEEGCLSIPNYRDTVPRSASIVVEAMDRNGQGFKFEASGLLAICIQHEIDHLDGILFVDRLSRLKRELFRRWHRKQLENQE